MPKESLPDLSITLTFLRSGQGWSQSDLGEVSGISVKLLNDYERGRKTLTRERLNYLAACMGLPPACVDHTLDRLNRNRAASRAPGASGGGRLETLQRVESLAAEVGTLFANATRSTLSLLTLQGEALQARQEAGFLWEKLAARKPTDRRHLVEHGSKFRTWALSEKVAAESIRKAANHPQEALELAELALLIAELVPGEQAWKLRLQGYAWAHIGNARRASNDLPGANEAISKAWKLWEAGAPGDPGLLNPAWLPWIEAVLRRHQRRLPEALKCIAEALTLDSGALRGEILLSKARIHETLGDPEASTASLLEAAPLIDPIREPRNAWALRINLAVDLCHLERFQEAEVQLPEVRILAERLGEELDLTRVVWLEGRILAGLGKISEALTAFEQARRVFIHRQLGLESALVNLEEACLLLRDGRTSEVKRLAEEMVQLFRTQNVEREALAALQLFFDAARQETATLDLTRRIVQYLYRAQHDPELRFADE
jgi:transcriptional regulator with XRE-family HTH domain